VDFQKIAESILERKKYIMPNNNPNTSEIVRLAREKSEMTEKKVFSILKSMIKEKKVINFNTVAKEANVSKSYIYKNESVRNKINLLRNEQSNLRSINNHKSNTSDKSKDVIIESLKFKIERLEKENIELKQALSAKYEDFFEKL
jgi:hypothetical protein